MAEHAIIKGELYLYKRGRTVNYYARYRVSDNQFKRSTTGTGAFDDAKKIGIKLYTNARTLMDEGVVVPKTGKIDTFASIAIEYRERLHQEQLNGIGKPVYKTYIETVDNWLAPYFKDIELQKIDDYVIDEFELYRKQKMGREPSKTTINIHNVVMRAVFDLARKRKLINSSQIPKLTVKNKGSKTVRRPHFSAADLEQLHRKMMAWSKKSDRSGSRYKRQLLYLYVQFLSNSGVRPGNEMKGICWKHIDRNYINPHNKKPYIRITLPHRKTKDNDYIFVSIDFGMHLDALEDLTRRTDPDDLLFCNQDGTEATGFSGMFRWALEDVNMRYNELEQARTLYSLRHTYATDRILNHNADWNILANQMGISHGMLEKHYVHLRKELAADSFGGSYDMELPKKTVFNDSELENLTPKELIQLIRQS